MPEEVPILVPEVPPKRYWSRDYDPVWAAAVAHGMPVFIHVATGGVKVHEEKSITASYHLWNSNGWEDCAAGVTAVTSLMRVHQVLTRRADQILAPLDLTFSRYELLVRLYFQDGSLPLNQLGRALSRHPRSRRHAWYRPVAAVRGRARDGPRAE